MATVLTAVVLGAVLTSKFESKRLMALSRDTRAQYVLVNLAVNLLFLLRSYVFLIALGYRDLGLVALLQSIVMLLGILQFGTLNGGYRLLLSATDKDRGEINDFVYSFILAIGLLSLSCAIVIGIAVIEPMDAWVVVAGAAGGAFTLMRTWQTNQMIADGRLGSVNAINVVSALASLICLAFVPIAPLAACVASIVVQPTLFALLGWISQADRRPRRFLLTSRLLKRTLATGFVIFLAGMLLQFNVQLERWYVVAELGVEALGHLFIAIMFVTLLQIVPAALDAVFLPSAVRAYSDEDDGSLVRVMRNYLALLLAYAGSCAAATYLLAEPILRLIAPVYVQDLIYVYLIAPGALLLTVTSAIALTFTVLIRYRYILMAYSIGSGALAAVFLAAIAIDRSLSLEEVTIARSAGLALTAILVVAGWWIVTHNNRQFRFTRSVARSH